MRPLKLCEQHYSVVSKVVNHEAHEEHEGFNRGCIMEFDDLSNRVLGCALEVHRNLGPGLLETAYGKCLAYELRANGLNAVCQKPLPVVYKGVELDCGYRLDIVVENSLMVELKSVDHLSKVHEAQILTYMKLSGIHIGLLLNFNEVLLKNGLKRFVL